MNFGESLKVNSPNVVHETIDGETIILNLLTGIYFSVNDVGSIVWQFIVKTGNWKKVFEILNADIEDINNKNTQNIVAFINELVTEKLLVENQQIHNNLQDDEIEKQLKSFTSKIIEPKLNKYSDMQDLLLLDPIHEVDEVGWPESIDMSEDKNVNRED